jgi:hypothetical protein
MDLRYTPNGTPYQEPPYTPAEEAEFYRRMSGGPVTVVKPATAPSKNRRAATLGEEGADVSREDEVT